MGDFGEQERGAGHRVLQHAPRLGFRHPDFRISGSGFFVSGLEFRVLCFGFQVTGSWFLVSGSGFRDLGSRFRVSVSGFRVPDSGVRVSGSGHPISFRVPGLGRPGPVGVSTGIPRP